MTHTGANAYMLGSTTRPTRPLPNYRLMFCAVPHESSGLLHGALTPMFSGTMTRHSTLGTTARDTNTMTLPLHPHPVIPIRQPTPLLLASTKSPSTRRRIRNSCPLHAGCSSCFVSLARPSVLPVLPLWCVAIEASSTRVIC